MATYRQTGYGWRAEVERKGVYRSKSAFPTKGAAVAWASRVEADILAGERGEIPSQLVKALFERYEREVTPHKKGERWELIRLTRFKEDRIAAINLRNLAAPHASDWQTRRLQEVSSATVRRERNLLNNIFEIGRKEWKWLAKNPFEGIRRPRDSRPRNRTISATEHELICKHASPELRRVCIIAYETGMREGEIASNPPIRGRVAYLADSKNGEGRAVPLSQAALEAWSEPVGITAASISVMFGTLCRRLEIQGATFHDYKHTAMTRLSKKLDAWELAKMTGNKDLKILLNVYYKMDPDQVADKL